MPALIDPNALSLLLAKTAPEWSDEEVEQYIQALRAERQNYLAAEAASKKPKSDINSASKAAIREGIKAGNIEMDLDL